MMKFSDFHDFDLPNTNIPLEIFDFSTFGEKVGIFINSNIFCENMKNLIKQAADLLQKALDDKEEQQQDVKFETKRVECEMCDTALSDVYSLQSHIRTFHSETEITCNKCNSVFTSGSDMLNHSNTCVFNCSHPNCEFTAKYLSRLRIHLIKKHKEEIHKHQFC